MPGTGQQPHRPGKPSPGNSAGAPRPKPGVKPPQKAARAPAPKPGEGLLGWLGRQVGHVKKAVQTDVTKPGGRAQGGTAPGGTAGSGGGGGGAKPKPVKPPGPQAGAPRPPRPQGQGGQAGGASGGGGGSPASMVVYRNDKIEEAEMPDRPGVKLRRTIIDEVIVEKKEE